MDRRQKKTREAILKAFTELLSKKHYHQISVQEIIDAADVGRSTFYAHFETKDYLLKELCEDLTKHLTESAHGHISDTHGAASQSIFYHLLLHIQENNQNILDLLSSPNNEIFLRYFKSALNELVLSQYEGCSLFENSDLPQDYLINHIASSFLETVYWWISRNMQESSETIAHYFMKAVSLIQ